MARISSTVILFGLLLLLTPPLTHGQRGRGGSVGGVGAARGTGVGTMRGTGIGTVGGVDRRTAVIAGAINNGNLGNGVRDGWGGGRPGIGGGVAYPGLAAGAIARRVPIGTVIEVLPPDCSMTFITEMEYYYCSGQYYQPMGSAESPIYVAAEPYIPEY